MPAFWSSKSKAPPISTVPTSVPAEDRALSAYTRSSEENELPSGQVTPKPSGLDNRIPAISSVRSYSSTITYIQPYHVLMKSSTYNRRHRHPDTLFPAAQRRRPISPRLHRLPPLLLPSHFRRANSPSESCRLGISRLTGRMYLPRSLSQIAR